MNNQVNGQQGQPAVTSAQPTMAELLAQIEALKAEKVAILASKGKPKRDTTPIGNGLSVAVSDKGAVSIYGLGRFPVTLYRSQIEALGPCWAQLLAFISANASKLQTKTPVK